MYQLMLNAFGNLNNQGNPVNVANATPVLDTFPILTTMAVTGGSPTVDSEKLYILPSANYGLGTGSTNPLSGSLQVTLSKPATVGIYVNGNLQRQYTAVPAGRTVIDFAASGLEVNIAFGDYITVKLTRETEDSTLTLGKVVVYQAL